MQKYYDEKSECPKCRNNKISTRFIPGLLIRQEGEMRRRCVRCGHVWYEKPLDCVKD